MLGLDGRFLSLEIETLGLGDSISCMENDVFDCISGFVMFLCAATIPCRMFDSDYSI